MTQRHFRLFDDQQGVYAYVEPDVATSLTASLSADPESIEEFHRAMKRFFHPEFAQTVRAMWTETTLADEIELDDTVLVDLPGRLIVYRGDPILRCDDACYLHTELQPQGVFRYHLSSEWLLTQDDISVRELAQSRRSKRRAGRVDLRSVLFGEPMIEFLGEQARQAFVRERPRLDADWQQQRAGGWFRRGNDVYRLARGIHRDWLMTERPDLGGRRIRDAMVVGNEHISMDISHRSSQWVQQQACPAGLDQHDAAFVYGDLGVHEIILYYDLVRELLLGYFEHLIEHSAPSPGSQWLTTRRDEWMETPQVELVGLTPREAIERERLRLPLIDPPGHEMTDDDCLICRMSAELGTGPAFIHLDAFHFDGEFAFSLHACEEDWQVEQAAVEASFERFESEWRQESCAEVDTKGRTDAIWQRVFVNQEMLGRSVGEDTMAVGFFLSELIEDLKCHSGNDEFVEQLNRHFNDLTPAVIPNDLTVLQPIITRLGETLDDVARHCPDLSLKCLDLQSHLARMAELLEH